MKTNLIVLSIICGASLYAMEEITIGLHQRKSSKIIKKEPVAIEENDQVKQLYNLGHEYRKQKNFEKAFDCFLKAAKLNDQKSMYNVALCYQHGLGVAKPEQEKAIKWFVKAALLGNEDAKCQLEFVGSCRYTCL